MAAAWQRMGAPVLVLVLVLAAAAAAGVAAVDPAKLHRLVHHVGAKATDGALGQIEGAWARDQFPAGELSADGMTLDHFGGSFTRFDDMIEAMASGGPHALHRAPSHLAECISAIVNRAMVRVHWKDRSVPLSKKSKLLLEAVRGSNPAKEKAVLDAYVARARVAGKPLTTPTLSWYSVLETRVLHLVRQRVRSGSFASLDRLSLSRVGSTSLFHDFGTLVLVQALRQPYASRLHLDLADAFVNRDALLLGQKGRRVLAISPYERFVLRMAVAKDRASHNAGSAFDMDSRSFAAVVDRLHDAAEHIVKTRPAALLHDGASPFSPEVVGYNLRRVGSEFIFRLTYDERKTLLAELPVHGIAASYGRWSAEVVAPANGVAAQQKHA